MLGPQKVSPFIASSSGQPTKNPSAGFVNNTQPRSTINDLVQKGNGNQISPISFSEKNNPPVAEAKKINSNPPSNLQIADLPVHTMQKDMENSADSKNSGSGIPAGLYSKKTEEEKISGVQKTSPFLDPKNKLTLENRIDKEIQSTAKGRSQEYGFWGKIVTIAIIAFVILAVGIGGYYFWITRQKPTEPIAETPSSPAIEEPVLPFSIDKPNYLNIDLENSDSDKIKQLLSQKAQEVIDSKITSPIEFIISDLQNNPVNFEEFTAKAGIVLPIELTSNLNNGFSLFVLNDNSKVKMGLSVDSRDDDKLKSALLQEEPNLSQDLSFLLSLSSGSYPSEFEKSFSSSSYKGAEIRYLNIISPEELSIDYVLYNNKLFFGTTKLTLRSIIDYTDNQAAVKGMEDINDDKFLYK